MLTVHHLENSRSQRVLWLLEELGLPYEVKRYERGPDLRAPAALKRVHPLGKAPLLADGDRVIAETGAIVEYLLAKDGTGRLMPAEESADHWTARHFLHHAEGTAMPPLLLFLVLSEIPRRAPGFLKPILKPAMDRVKTSFVGPEIDANVAHWETALERTGWFAGPDLTAADIMMSFPVEAAGQRLGLAGRPKLEAFLKAIHARPAYRAALERGGPYAYA